MAKADIWMPFYVADYLADTMHLSAAEHGAYLMLILHYWRTGPIPNDPERLANISRLGDAWSNASSTLLAFFEQCDGMLHHRRIDREKQDALDNKERNEARAKAAADKRWANHAPSNASSNATPVLKTCPSPSPSSPIKPKSKADALATRLPAGWIPSFEDAKFCAKNRPDLSIDETAERFRDYWIAQPGVKGRKADWSATWRNWVRNEKVSAKQKPEAKEPPWWSSDALIEKKGRELGLTARAGEDWAQFRGRINAKLGEKVAA